MAIDWTPWLQGLVAATLGDAGPEDRRRRLERARTLLHEQYAEPIDLETVARHVYLSRYHFARQFRREFGVTPHQYLTQRRLDAAKQLLQSADRTVTEVCFSVGYGSVGSFSSLFARHVGLSPERYRRKVFAVADWVGPQRLVPGCFAGWGRS